MNHSTKRTVLVIEDNEINRGTLCIKIEDKYNILEAENGLIGLNILKEKYKEISVILLDLQMPVMDGYEFLSIVQQDSLLSAIPVIVITASNTAEEQEKCLASGASDFIQKNELPSIIRHRINNVIKLRESASTISAIEYDLDTGIYTRPAFIHHATKMLQDNPDIRFTLIIAQLQRREDSIGDYSNVTITDMMQQAVGAMRKELNDDNIGGRYSSTRLVCLRPYTPDYVPTNYTFTNKNGLVCTLKYGIIEDVRHDLSIMNSCANVLSAIESINHQFNRYYAIYDNAMYEKQLFQSTLEKRMTIAIRDGSFKVYYQPKHDIATGRLVGAEALIRWVDQELGFISPGEFIPLFEQTQFIIESDLYVWERTCANQRRWAEKGLSIVPVSVNCSQKGFAAEDMTSRWLEAKQRIMPPEDSLHIEITESSFIGSTETMTARLDTLRANGVEIELDDFGSGYSSLNMLGILPIDIVKLDMGFVDHLDQPKRKKVMSACVKLIHDLNYKIVVEGIETEEQLSTVRSLGIDYAQGYYFSKPIPEEEFEAYLSSH